MKDGNRTKWMLRVSYDMGPNFCDSERIRNKEFRGYPSEYLAFEMKRQIFAHGFVEHKADTDLTYEWWVAPSQIFGLALIEYKAYRHADNEGGTHE